MIRWIIAALLIYLALIIYQLPAQFVLSLVETPKALYIGGVEGSIWHGETDTVSWQGQSIDQLQWQFSFAALLQGRLELQVDAGSRKSLLKFSGKVGLNRNGWYAEQVEFQFPAALVAELYPMPATLQGAIKGSIAVANQGTPWCQQLQGEVNWHSPVIVSKLLGQPLALDKTTAQLRCDEQGQVVAQLSDSGRVLGLAVTATLEAQTYRVEGELEPGPDFPEKFKQGLGFFATPIGGERYRITLDGPLE